MAAGTPGPEQPGGPASDQAHAQENHMSVASPPAPPPTIDPPATTTGKRRGRKPGGSRFPAAPWVLLPSIILTFIFVYGFIAFSGWISVSQWNRPTRQDLDL